VRFRVFKRNWNVVRKQGQGERLLRMAGVADIAAARVLWEEPSAPVHARCLAARAIGLLSKDGPERLRLDVDDDSPLSRAWRHGIRDANRRTMAELPSRQEQEAVVKMRDLGTGSIAEVILLMKNRSEILGRRESAAFILAGLKCRDAVEPLIEVLSEGHQKLSWICMSALTAIRSRRHARKLMDIVRGNYPLPARQEAVYTLWHLQELRAEQLFIRISAAADSEEEYTRDMATEALGNTARRTQSQKALATRLFDPSVSVRYAALCALTAIFPQPYAFPDFLRLALEAKLTDPDRVDDNRIIAQLAAQLLGRAC
jgi:HEAT repeat protein